MFSTCETKASSLRSSFNGIRRLAASGMVIREGLRCGGGRRQGGTNEREGYGDEGVKSGYVTPACLVVASSTINMCLIVFIWDGIRCVCKYRSRVGDCRSENELFREIGICWLSNVNVTGIREAPLKFMLGAFGHCPFSFCPPPPHSNGHSGALFSGPI